MIAALPNLTAHLSFVLVSFHSLIFSACRSSAEDEEAQQVETQQPLSAALFTCSPVVLTSTPRPTLAPADRGACSLTLCAELSKALLIR